MDYTTVLAGLDLPALVRSKFQLAEKSGDLTFYSTQVQVVDFQGVPFQVRFSLALANKPKLDKSTSVDKTSRFNPFEKPLASLLVASLLSHNVVLNKFPIISDHFIIATQEYKSQTDLLEEDDLAVVYGCLRAWRQSGEGLFSFFNSGEYSGASQPHRHIQFLPISSMEDGTKNGEWELLIPRLMSASPAVPFTYFASPLPDNSSPSTIHEIYIDLYEKACQMMRESGIVLPSNDKTASQMSYNLGITDSAMVLCPRTSEGIEIQSMNGELVGPVALNGSLLGGTVLAKSEAEWDALRSDKSKLFQVLRAIGVPSQDV